jgi:ABC-type transporter Mla maintaining outer membrane lipid asymmetry ATPase subunit MlaF
MLQNGNLLAVGSKEEFVHDTHPRIRQFLDRQPDPIAGGPAQGFESWLQRS